MDQLTVNGVHLDTPRKQEVWGWTRSWDWWDIEDWPRDVAQAWVDGVNDATRAKVFVFLVGNGMSPMQAMYYMVTSIPQWNPSVEDQWDHFIEVADLWLSREGHYDMALGSWVPGCVGVAALPPPAPPSPPVGGADVASGDSTADVGSHE